MLFSAATASSSSASATMSRALLPNLRNSMPAAHAPSSALSAVRRRAVLRASFCSSSACAARQSPLRLSDAQARPRRIDSTAGPARSSARRALSTSTPTRSEPASPSSSSLSSSSSSTSSSTSTPSPPTYHGPLVRTFARLKLFSLGSLLLATGMCPVLLLAPGQVGLGGRVGLCLTALATSGVSTAIIAWIGGPYVGRMTLAQPPPQSQAQAQAQVQVQAGTAQLVAETLSWRLRPIRTTIYEPSFLRGTSRPFATWELATSAPLSAELLQRASAPSSSGAAAPNEGTKTLLVAESVDVRSGKVLGRWLADLQDSAAAAAGEGKTVQCKSEGKPVRHFNVHDELLGEEWQIL